MASSSSSVRLGSSGISQTIGSYVKGSIQPRGMFSDCVIVALKDTATNGNWFTARASFLLRTVGFVATSALEAVIRFAVLLTGTIQSLCVGDFTDLKASYKEVLKEALLLVVHAVASVPIGAIGTLFPSVHCVYAVHLQVENQ